MIAIREADARDREAILELRKRCFPDDDVEKQDARFWDWEFGRGRMFVAEAEGHAVAHLGFVPQTWRIDGQSYQGMLAVDAMTDPEFRRQGIFQRVAAHARDALRSSVALSTAFQIRDAVLPPMTENGWRPLLRAPVLVKMLNIRSAGLRPAGPPASSRLVSELAEELLRNTAHTDRTDLTWRFTENPRWTYTIDANDHAYIVTRRTTLRGYDTLAIADIAWRPGETREAKLLLREVVARGRAAGIQLAATLMTLSHPALPVLVRAGFLPSPHRFRFLVNVFDERIRASRARWALTWADTDHL
jgi:GNAT superfamily N-acetyltransferase